MTVRELIEKLSALDPGDVVIMARDEEGNGFNEVGELQLCAYDKGDIYLRELTPHMEAQGYTDEDVADATPAVCLWP